MTRPARSHGPRHWRPADTHLRAAWVVVLLAFGLSIGWLLTKGPADAAWPWLHGAFIFLVALMSVCSVARRLPIQNIVPAALIVFGMSAIVIATLAYYGSDPAKNVGFGDSFGPSILNSNEKRLLPWQVPFLVVAMTLCSRETARLMLRPWRRERNYGWWLLGVSTVLVLIICVALEPFANSVADWWKWQSGSTQSAESWYGTPWWAFVYWCGLVVAVYWFAGPWLIVKRPLSMIPDLTSAGVWLLLVIYFTAGNSTKGHWLAVTAALVAAVPVCFMAWRGWRLSQPPVTSAPAAASSNGAA